MSLCVSHTQSRHPPPHRLQIPPDLPPLRALVQLFPDFYGLIVENFGFDCIFLRPVQLR
ncbi:hypothetical protein [Phaeodactylibacter sp.]|uniref:hypothetical protein n=1 Tax=Phaeodactylibacter sp. TaxID=1940289 RepID=UPI0025F541B5|nr:hypothetical protein [Phaeodactylibacter sp.]MCI4647318.1 hypothetical protein [Phaeodactylibacter sp.]MCI5089407.1 hypothetical protein [Phaeodactylibacter sp.]